MSCLYRTNLGLSEVELAQEAGKCLVARQVSGVLAMLVDVC